MPIRKISAALVAEICNSIHNLTVLNLSRNEIASIENIERLVSLTKLDLSHNLIREPTGLESLTNLTHLDLSSNSIHVLTGLERLGSLEVLHLADNNLTTADVLRSLCYLQNLHTLTLRGNPLASLQNYRSVVAQRLPSLRVLDGEPLAQHSDTSSAPTAHAATSTHLCAVLPASVTAPKQSKTMLSQPVHSSCLHTCQPAAASQTPHPPPPPAALLSARSRPMRDAPEKERHLAEVAAIELRHHEEKVQQLLASQPTTFIGWPLPFPRHTRTATRACPVRRAKLVSFPQHIKLNDLDLHPHARIESQLARERSRSEKSLEEAERAHAAQLGLLRDEAAHAAAHNRQLEMQLAETRTKLEGEMEQCRKLRVYIGAKANEALSGIERHEGKTGASTLGALELAAAPHDDGSEALREEAREARAECASLRVQKELLELRLEAMSELQQLQARWRQKAFGLLLELQTERRGRAREGAEARARALEAQAAMREHSHRTRKSEAERVVMRAELDASRASLHAAEHDTRTLRAELDATRHREAEARQLAQTAVCGLGQLAREQHKAAAEVQAAAQRLEPLQQRLHFAVQRCAVLPQLLQVTRGRHAGVCPAEERVAAPIASREEAERNATPLPPHVHAEAKLYSVEEAWRERLQEAHAAAGQWQQQQQQAAALADASEARRAEAEAAAAAAVAREEAAVAREEAAVHAAEAAVREAQQRCEQHVALIAMVQAEAAQQRQQLEAKAAADCAAATAALRREGEEALAAAAAASAAAERQLRSEVDAVKEEEAAKRRQLEEEVAQLKREVAKSSVARRSLEREVDRMRTQAEEVVTLRKERNALLSSLRQLQQQEILPRDKVSEERALPTEQTIPLGTALPSRSESDDSDGSVDDADHAVEAPPSRGRATPRKAKPDASGIPGRLLDELHALSNELLLEPRSRRLTMVDN
ncbi:hypothetical protein AB1Y20_018272 [Prymnesium parvum]|uniref:Uncharacterized protein n=1 Tax=Prymnesium parvum TaxID=97485 RepID=A0AB34JN55_PRYPA